MDLIHLLVYVLVLCLVAGLVWYIINMMPIPQPFKNIVICVFCVILIIIILNMAGVLSGNFRVGELNSIQLADEALR